MVNKAKPSLFSFYRHTKIATIKVAQMVKNLPAMQKTQSLSWEDSFGERNGYLLKYCCLENCIQRRAWQATVHGVAKSWTLPRLKFFLFFFFHSETIDKNDLKITNIYKAKVIKKE